MQQQNNHIAYNKYFMIMISKIIATRRTEINITTIMMARLLAVSILGTACAYQLQPKNVGIRTSVSPILGRYAESQTATRHLACANLHIAQQGRSDVRSAPMRLALQPTTNKATAVYGLMLANILLFVADKIIRVPAIARLCIHPATQT